MSDSYEPCPNDCSSGGEVWSGEGLRTCPVCKGHTVVKSETNSNDPCDDWADHPIPSKPKEDNKENKDGQH
jgi:hypothetical protein